MKKTIAITYLCLSTLYWQFSSAQSAYDQNGLSLSFSTGSSHTRFATRHHQTSNSDKVFSRLYNFKVNYYFTSHFGFGLKYRSDQYQINTQKLYNYSSTDGQKVNFNIGSVIFDLSFKSVLTEKLSLTSFIGLGKGKVQANDPENIPERYDPIADTYVDGGFIDHAYAASNGVVFNTGIGVNYSVTRRVYLTVDLSYLSGSFKENDNCSMNPFGKNYQTSTKGLSTELGVCFKLK